jgi:hypothetical protein
MSSAALTAEPVREDSSLSAAYRLLWLAVIFDFLAFGVGFDWDRRWHATHPFEDFFSPPHLFIYSMHLCATITLAYIAFTPNLRRWFGAAFRLPPFPFPVPGPIALAGAGFVLIALAGVFDGIWHTSFGLDETGWSFPHSMLGWGIFVAFLGNASCRVALREWRPIGIWSALVFGLLILETSVMRFAGPLATNLSREVVELIARIPVLAAEPAFQHTARIYITADLTRHNPLFVPLISLSAGMGLGLLRAFDARAPVTVLLTALASWTSTLIPFLIPGIILAVGRTHPETAVIRVLAAAGFALTTAVIWQGSLVGAIVGTVLFYAGLLIAERVWSVVARPTRSGVLAIATVFGLALPALTGVVDLALRARIP